MGFVNQEGKNQTPGSKPIEPPLNDPHLMRLVKVKVTKSFRVGGRELAIGELVEIQFHLALDLRAMGKCALVSEG